MLYKSTLLTYFTYLLNASGYLGADNLGVQVCQACSRRLQEPQKFIGRRDGVDTQEVVQRPESMVARHQPQLRARSRPGNSDVLVNDNDKENLRLRKLNGFR